MLVSKTKAMTRSIFDSQNWSLTVGILLAVTLNAFEALAVVTIAPQVAAALSGVGLYGWVFSGFLLSSLIGTVLGGQYADRYGPARPFAFGLVLFGIGLLLGGFAPSMWIFVLGRVIQGFGGGALVTSIYAVVTLAYPDQLRSRMMAFMSSAWVLPALLGPAAAGFLAEAFSWRIVFWGMLPLVALVFVLTARAFRTLDRSSADFAKTNRLPMALLLVGGTGIFLLGLSLRPWWLAGLAIFLGASAFIFALQAIMPHGTLRLKQGLPAIIAARGLFYAGFVGVEAFLALMLTSVHGYSAALTGVAVATGAISWTLGSWLQERLDARWQGQRRHLRILWGTSILATGLAIQLLALYSDQFAFALAIAGWMLSGLGIGLAHATSSVLAFALAPEGEAGMVAASLQIADQFTSSLSAGVGGALLALATSLALGERSGIASAFVFSVMLVCLSIFAGSRVHKPG